MKVADLNCRMKKIKGTITTGGNGYIEAFPTGSLHVNCEQKLCPPYVLVAERIDNAACRVGAKGRG